MANQPGYENVGRLIASCASASRKRSMCPSTRPLIPALERLRHGPTPFARRCSGPAGQESISSRELAFRGFSERVPCRG